MHRLSYLAIALAVAVAASTLFSRTRAEEPSDGGPQAAVSAASSEDMTDATAVESTPPLSTGTADSYRRADSGDDSFRWGDRVTWSQLKGFQWADPGRLSDGRFSTGYPAPPIGELNVAIAPLPPALAATRAYAGATRQLDQIASELEDARQFEEADAVRNLCQSLRLRARHLPAEPPAIQNFSFNIAGGR